VPGQADHQTYFAYDGHQIVAQFDKDGSGAVTGANLSHRYLWGPAVDQVLADEQLSPLPLGEGQCEGFDLAHAGSIVWPLADNLGTVRDLAVSQNGITSVANHRVFDTYGNLRSQTNAAVDYVFGFTGFLTDKVTGLYISQTRPYDPLVGRWGQPDRDGFLGRDTNLNRYCGNSPTDSVDPTGMWRWFGWFRGPDWKELIEQEVSLVESLNRDFGKRLAECVLRGMVAWSASAEVGLAACTLGARR
jgi:RHS repeat-associated protein